MPRSPTNVIRSHPNRAHAGALLLVDLAGEHLLKLGQVVFILQGQFDGLNVFGGTGGQVEQGPFLDGRSGRARLAVRLPEQDLFVDLAALFGFDPFEVHVGYQNSTSAL